MSDKAAFDRALTRQKLIVAAAKGETVDAARAAAEGLTLEDFILVEKGIAEWRREIAAKEQRTRAATRDEILESLTGRTNNTRQPSQTEMLKSLTGNH